MANSNKSDEIRGVKHLTNYVCVIFEEGDWETERFVEHGDVYAHAICRHDDFPSLGLITYYSDADGFGDGGGFAERLGWLFESAVAAQAENGIDVDMWAMIVKANFSAKPHQSDFLEYLLNHFGFGYLDFDRNRRKDARVTFDRQGRGALPCKPDAKRRSVPMRKKYDTDAVWTAVERGRKRRMEYGMASSIWPESEMAESQSYDASSWTDTP